MKKINAIQIIADTIFMVFGVVWSLKLCVIRCAFQIYHCSRRRERLTRKLA